MLCRNKLWETITLLLISLMVFRPGLFWDQIYLPTVNFNASQLEQIARNLPHKAQLHIKVRGEDFDQEIISVRAPADRPRKEYLYFIALGVFCPYFLSTTTTTTCKEKYFIDKSTMTL